MSVEKRESTGSTKVASALSEAQSIIDVAESRAKDLTRAADERYQQARADGYRDGFEQGRRDAAVQAVRLIEETTAVQDTLAEEAAKLALAICANIIGTHVRVEPQAVQRLARNAIQEAVIGETVTLVIHPEDEKSINETLVELRRIAGGAAISIETNSTLTLGGCIVRTDFGEVDASIEVLLQGIAERLGVPVDG